MRGMRLRSTPTAVLKAVKLYVELDLHQQGPSTNAWRKRLPGALRLVQHLARHSIPFAVASSTPRQTFEAKMAGTAQVRVCVIVCARARVCKTEYLLACEFVCGYFCECAFCGCFTSRAILHAPSDCSTYYGSCSRT
jgi:hypothetical protein